MKRICATILILSFLFPSYAFAAGGVLAGGWWNASLEDEMRRNPDYETIFKIMSVLGASETESGWIPKVYKEVKRDISSERKRYDLDTDYLMNQYETYTFEEWL